MDSSGMMARISGWARSWRLKPTLKNLGRFVIAHGERHFQVTAGVESAGIDKMPLAEAAGALQQGHNFIVSGNQMHRI